MAFIDPNDFEKVALENAGELGGAYIASEGMHLVTADKWTREQFTAMVECIVSGYIESLMDQQDQALRATRKITNLPPLGAGEFPSFVEKPYGEFPS